MGSLKPLAPAALLVVGLLAGCGRDRSREAAGADTTGAAVVTSDSGPTAVAGTSDSTRSAPPDTGRSRTAPAADTTGKPGSSVTPAPKSPATDTGAKRVAARAAEGKKPSAREARTTHDTAAAPTGQAGRDTARVAKAESTTSKATTEPSEAPLRDAYHQAPRDTVTQAVYNGWKQFNLNCARCHGEDVLGTTIAPHLIVSLKPDGPINTKELFVQTVCAGRPAKGMPSWCALGLDMGKINEIYQYVKGRSDAKIGPGRPAVKQQG